MAGITPTGRLVSCPRCRKQTVYSTANAFRPFCSAVCKDEDIIAWAEHGYAIPGEPVAPSDAEGDGMLRPRDDEED